MIVYQGSGVMDVNPIFKKVVKYNDKLHLLPKKA
jgi:hypothetical protein